MSARTRFVAQPKDKDSSKADADGNDDPPRPRTDAPPTVPTDVRAPLNDSSNTPRLTRQNNQFDDQVSNISDAKSLAGTVDGSVIRGVDKPLNIANLRSVTKNKKAGDAVSNQTKKPRGSIAADRLKGSETLSRMGSPKPLAPHRNMNTRNALSPFTHNSTDGSSFGTNNNSEVPQARIQTQSNADIQMHLNSGNLQVHQTRRLPVPSPRRGMDSLDSSTSTLYTPLSPTSNMSQNRNLDPARRELFPLRSGNQLGTAHIRSSLSPPPSGQHHCGSDQIFDITIPLGQHISGKEGSPINLDTFEGLDSSIDQHNQGRLRRTTKRIGQQGIEEGEQYARLGKRMRMDGTAFKENMVVDYAPAHQGGYQNRDNTPVHQQLQPAQAGNQQDTGSQGQNTELDHHALYRLLGADMDRYFADNLERYENTRKRWTDCKLEDWQAGANEMTEKFSKIIELVRTHMVKKMELFTTLHAKVQDHNKTLGDRNAALEKMQGRLVKDSVSVLGGVNNHNA